MGWQENYLGKYYTSRPGYKDGTSEYYELIERYVPATAEVLELGAGPTNEVSAFLARTFSAVDGLDIGEACKNNEHLRQAYVYDGEHFPMDDQQYDAVVCNYVLEHVEKPVAVVAEIKRILRPGGVFLFRAPNKWHYVSMVARCTPHWFHEMVANRLRNLAEEADEPYPTFHRMNSRRQLKSLFGDGGFERLALSMIEKEPSYGMSNRVLFFLFMAYERLVNSMKRLAGLRANILGAFRKPSE